MKLITGGGLGDAVLAWCKLQSKDAPFSLQEIKSYTHFEVHDNLIRPIQEFYTYQFLNFLPRIKVIPSTVFLKDWDKVKPYKESCDYWIGTHWYKGKEENLWEINPSPSIHYNPIINVDVVIFPLSGRSSTRQISIGQIESFVEYYAKRRWSKVYLLGNINSRPYDELERKYENCTNLMGKTSLKTAIDMVCSSNSVIGPSGFGTFLGAAAGKVVYMLSEGQATLNRVHPKWKVYYI